MKKEMKLVCGFFAAGLVLSAVAAEPTISDVKVHRKRLIFDLLTLLSDSVSQSWTVFGERQAI